jgi:4'-phosphopantetheinyl transferase
VVATRLPIDGPVLRVQSWPGPVSIDSTASGADANPIVFSIATPHTSIRDTARELARQALREVLGVLLDLAPETVQLVSRPGHPIRLDIPGLHAGLSVSHEPALTIAAIHLRGPVGVDLMGVEQDPDWLPDWLSDWEALARDYLGPQASDRIAKQPTAQRGRAFAREWTRFEASLKCLAMPLQEWSPALEHELMRCRLFDLDVPDGFIGSLAVYVEPQISHHQI